MLTLHRLSEPDDRQADGCLAAQTMCRLCISWLTTVAVAESSFLEAPGEHLLLEPGALILLPQLPSPSLFSLLELLSLACPSSVSAGPHLLFWDPAAPAGKSAYKLRTKNILLFPVPCLLPGLGSIWASRGTLEAPAVIFHDQESVR